LGEEERKKVGRDGRFGLFMVEISSVELLVWWRHFWSSVQSRLRMKDAFARQA
jgi:hypothetical protein